MAVHPGVTVATHGAATAQSDALFARAKTLIPGGVNSPGARLPRGRRHAALHRARRRAHTSRTRTARRYLDFVLSWGPMILGHAHPEVLAGGHRSRRDAA
jgi:glutamate-1-semialdehyde 2,1-aminomutase